LPKTKTLSVTILAILFLTLPLINTATAEEPSENTQTFFKSQWPGIKIQVNATAEALPGNNITVALLVESKADNVHVVYLNLTIFGFVEGQYKTNLTSIYQDDFFLNYNEKRERNDTLSIPLDVWDTTYGELSFQYSIEGFSYSLSQLGFTMTHVRNVYLENLEEQFHSLSENYTELQQNYTWLEGNYTELKDNYSELSKSVIELDNTRRAVIILAITTIFFVATTFYLFMRKPKQYF